MAFPPTDWGDFTPAEYAVRAPATSWSFERWFRNVVAFAQGATGAPWAYGAWHPYNSGEIGDGATGILWDHAVDGNVSMVTSPVLTAGYCYRIIADSYIYTGNAAVVSNIEVLLGATWTLAGAGQSITNGNSNNVRGLIDLDIGPLASRGGFKSFVGHNAIGSDVTTSTAGAITRSIFTSVPTSQVRVNFNTTVRAGKVFLLKRRIAAGAE